MKTMVPKNSKQSDNRNCLIIFILFSCWLSNSRGTFWAFLGPIMLIILVIIAVFNYNMYSYFSTDQLYNFICNGWKHDSK